MSSFRERSAKATAIMVAINLIDCANSTQIMLPLVLGIRDSAGIRRKRSDVRTIVILQEPLYRFARWLVIEAAAIPVDNVTSFGQNVHVRINLDGRYSVDSPPALEMNLATAPSPDSTTAVPVPGNFWHDDDESDPDPHAVAFTLFPDILGTIVLNVTLDDAVTIAPEFSSSSRLAHVNDFDSIMEPMSDSPEERLNMIALGIREPASGSRGMHFLKCEFN
jgi:hypothetical protein